jgi:phosphatidylglycerophosphate synthase
LGAGALDVVDGRVARSRNETSAFGAMLDLLGDRLLTFAAVGGLIVGGGLAGYDAIAGIVLVARDLLFASLHEALPGKLGARGNWVERPKVAAAFTGLALLVGGDALFVDAGRWGALALWLAALLTVITVVQYWLRALAAFRGGPVG